MKKCLAIVVLTLCAVPLFAQVDPQIRGAGAPSNPCANPGQMYVNTTNGDLYWCHPDTNWGLIPNRGSNVTTSSGGGGVWGSITGTLSSQTDLQTALNLLASIASPAFTGTPVAPTPTALDNSTKLGTTAYTDAAVGVESTARSNADALKAPLASPTLTGVPAAPTAAADTNTTQLATTAYVVGQGYAKLAGPTFTGTVTLPASQALVTPVLGTPTSGTLTNTTGYPWSALANPVSGLSLTMGSNTSIFNSTTALSQMFAFKNTTAAVVGTSQGSPIPAICGRAFHGSADVEDCLTLKELPGNGNDAAITFTIGHTGTSTGVVTTNFPGPVSLNGATSGAFLITPPAIAGTSTNPFVLSNIQTGPDGAVGTPTYSFTNSVNSGIYLNAGPAVSIAAGGSEIARMNQANVAFSQPTCFSLGNDACLSRDAAGVIDVGTGSSGSKAGSMKMTATSQTDASFGSLMTETVSACETAFAPTTLATGATTTDTGLNCLPANSIIDAVVARVTTTITAACTGWELGDATTAARFSSNNTVLTAGTTTDAAHIGTFNNTGIASATTGVWQAAAAKVRITCAGGNPGAGAIRVIVYYHSPTAPTS